VLFRDSDRAKKANDILGSHPDFRLLVRDKLSLGRAAEQLPDIRRTACLDMAIGWDPEARSETPNATARAVVIAREDREGASGLATAARAWSSVFETVVTDWGRHAPVPTRWRSARRLLRFNRK